MNSLISTLRNVFYQSNVLYSLRMLISLAGSTIIPYSLGQITLVIPVTLGVVAAGLTDFDTRFISRFLTILLTLICFAIASLSIQLLFDYPFLFITGLISSTFMFILLGALGQRFGVIAFGTLLIAAYTMLAHNGYKDFWTLPCFLLVGSLWYYLVSITESILQPIRPSQQNLSNCFYRLSHYLNAKAAMFDPDETDNFINQSKQLTDYNNQLIQSFNDTKRSLFNHLKSLRSQIHLRKLLNYYFIAQDIHERASSAHVQYQALSQHFKHSDILFRFARILNLQATACGRLAIAIKTNQTYHHDPLFNRYFSYLEDAILNYKTQDKTTLLLIKTLQNLYQNLLSIDLLLSNINNAVQTQPTQNYDVLSNDEQVGLNHFYLKIKQNLSLNSPLFRHAIRMSIVLTIGYLIILFSPLQHGYWIILTSLFVCQPNYSTTKYRLKLRVIGTILGILLGIPLTFLFPTVWAQLFLIILTGWLFFLFKNSQYAYATTFITLLVFFIFGLVGENSLNVAFDRFIATLIGCSIAWLAVNFIWPDWKFRNLSTLINRLFNDNNHYLALIVSQYLTSKNNDLQYRISRRAVHENNAELSALINQMSKEPHTNANIMNEGLRLLTLNQTFISYLSTLGAHRGEGNSAKTLEIFEDIATEIINMLYDNKLSADYDELKQFIISYIERLSNHELLTVKQTINENGNDLLIMQQLLLILNILPEIITVSRQLKHASISSETALLKNSHKHDK